MKISVVIPCYKSENSIEKVVNDLIFEFDRAKDKYDYEIVLVDDHSPDKVYSVIKRIAKENTNVIGLSLAKNFGEHGAVMAGFHHVSGDIVVVMDDDGQNPPSEIFKLVRGVENGSDVVFAKYESKKHHAIRNLGSKLNDKMATIFIGKPNHIVIMSYLACRRYVIDEVKKYSNPYPYIWGLILQVTSNISNEIVAHKEREAGKSSYTAKKLIRLWLNGFTAFSVKPLRFASLMGVLTSLLGLVFVVFTILEKFMNPNLPLGYSSIFSAVLLIGGILMIMLGMIGEYIGRIYISINNAPQFIVREFTSSKNTINFEKPL